MKKYFKRVIICLSFVLTSMSVANPITGLNTFAFQLYADVQTANENTVVSPFSLSALLSVISNGAEGTTRQQLLDVLNISGSDVAAVNALADQLIKNSNDLFIANALWGDKRFTYNNSFVELISRYHANHFFKQDFVNHPKEAVNAINSWVNSNTKGYIPSILLEGSVTPQTRLILTNAIYFKGSWMHAFKKTDTTNTSFTVVPNQTIQTPMMHKQDKFAYGETDVLQILQMRYNNSPLAFMILLPKDKRTLKDIQKNINQVEFAKIIAMLSSREVNVSIPKFKLQSTFDNLSTNLRHLGLNEAFTANANFKSLTDNEIYISQVIQKALIQVDEQGTVAAAATSMVFTTALLEPQKPILFTADHPFMFILYDTTTQLILFIGQVTNPSTA